ncbi:hypothetical protein KUV73_17680 [Mameliella alba]|nr:hypothetical protein [Mameliella alba]MBY6170985.1 hypothetical protein [Mameliella alba]MBY6176209.1 hypothetical protein [Mameliella alba]
MTNLRVPLLIGCLVGVIATKAWSCACCTDPGVRLTSSGPISAYEAGELAMLQPAARAGLYMSACGADCVQGVQDPASAYGVVFTLGEAFWTLDLKAEGTEATGTLRLTLPSSMDRRAVDPRPDPDGVMPVLLHEWRLVLPVAATGAFAAADGATGELILSGEGNHCVMADSFTHWSLSVTAPEVSFRLFGRLTPP